jgi:hypothetical protein
MAGSNSKETRGLNTKNWADPQIFLNGARLLVDSRKTRGLFNKIARTNRYLLFWIVGSRSGGSDLQLRQAGARSGGVVAGVRSPRRRLAGVGRSRCSGDQNNSSLGLGGSVRHG